MVGMFQANMKGLSINEIELLSRWELIQIIKKEIQILEKKLDQYIDIGSKNQTYFKLAIRKKKLEIVRLRSILKYIDVVKV